MTHCAMCDNTLEGRSSTRTRLRFYEVLSSTRVMTTRHLHVDRGDERGKDEFWGEEEQRGRALGREGQPQPRWTEGASLPHRGVSSHWHNEWWRRDSSNRGSRSLTEFCAQSLTDPVHSTGNQVPDSLTPHAALSPAQMYGRSSLLRKKTFFSITMLSVKHSQSHSQKLMRNHRRQISAANQALWEHWTVQPWLDLPPSVRSSFVGLDLPPSPHAVA